MYLGKAVSAAGGLDGTGGLGWKGTPGLGVEAGACKSWEDKGTENGKRNSKLKHINRPRGFTAKKRRRDDYLGNIQGSCRYKRRVRIYAMNMFCG